MCNSPLASNKPANIKIHIIEKKSHCKRGIGTVLAFYWVRKFHIIFAFCSVLFCIACVVCRIPLFETPWTVVHQACFSVHGISQARILDCVAISSSRRSSWPRDGTWVSCIGRWILCTEPPGKPSVYFAYYLSDCVWYSCGSGSLLSLRKIQTKAMSTCIVEISQSPEKFMLSKASWFWLSEKKISHLIFLIFCFSMQMSDSSSYRHKKDKHNVCEYESLFFSNI